MCTVYHEVVYAMTMDHLTTHTPHPYPFNQGSEAFETVNKRLIWTRKYTSYSRHTTVSKCKIHWSG